MLPSTVIKHKGHHRYLAFNNMAERFVPTDILFNILARIPASTLRRLKHVCKEWLQVISDPVFAEAHFACQSRKIDGWGIFLNTKHGICFMERTSECNPTQPQRMNLPGAHGETLVHDSCKGLVLYSSFGEDFKFHIANPITGESLTLPPFRGYNKPPISANIGSCGGEIKLVVVVKQIKHTLTTPYICGILTLGTKSWREMLSPIAGHRLQKQAVFTRGALHWSYDTGVLSLDLGQEKFYQTETTICSSIGPQKCILPVEWDGCYAAVFQQEHPPPSPFYRIWILRESEWTKQPDIDVEFFEGVGYYPLNKCPQFCTTMRNGEVLVFFHSGVDTARILVYDLSRQEFTMFARFYVDILDRCQSKGRLSLVPHVNSLISCSSSPSSLKRSGICGKGAMMSTQMFNFLSKFAHCACVMRDLLSYCKSHVCGSSYLSKILMLGRKLLNDCSSTQVEVYPESSGQDKPGLNYAPRTRDS